MSKIHKLYLFEGLNDQEIASLALEEKERLTREGRTVKHFLEGMAHPADMALHAYLSLEEYEEFLNDALAIHKYDNHCSREDLIERIGKQTHFEDHHAIIAYQQISFPSPDYDPLIADLAAREVYDGRLSYPEFKSLHLRRWKQFCKNALNTPNTVFFFEHSLFKHHIHELVGFYDMEDAMILNHLSALIMQVLPLNPVLYYVKTEELYDYITACDSFKTSCEDDLLHFVSTCNYGRLHRLNGRNGLYTFLKNRLRIEQLALNLFSSNFPELSICCCRLDKVTSRYPYP